MIPASSENRHKQIIEKIWKSMPEDSEGEVEAGYIIVRSASPVLASASNKLSAWVTMKMETGWVPHGNPQFFYEGEKFYIIQAMTK